jgi:hypothetical protein
MTDQESRTAASFSLDAFSVVQAAREFPDGIFDVGTDFYVLARPENRISKSKGDGIIVRMSANGRKCR